MGVVITMIVTMLYFRIDVAVYNYAPGPASVSHNARHGRWFCCREDSSAVIVMMTGPAPGCGGGALRG